MSDFTDYPGFTTQQVAEFTLYEAAFPKPETKLADIEEACQLALEHGCYCLYKLPLEGSDEIDCLAVPRSFISTVAPFYEWAMVNVLSFTVGFAGVRLTFGNGGPWDDYERLELQFTEGESPW
jgi:hypothetical protein